MGNNNKNKQNKNKKNKQKQNKPKPRGRTRTANVAQTKLRRTQPPRMKTDNTSCTITHSELIHTVMSGSGAFDSHTFKINPGSFLTFPWLSGIAPRYESYEFRRMRFRYEPIVPATVGGRVCMATDFDPSDTPPVSKEVMMSYAGANSTAPWSQLTNTLNPKDLNRYKTVHFTTTEESRVGLSDGTKRSLDIGSFYIATQGVTVNATPITTPFELGELYVEYTIVLRTPQVAISQSSSGTRQTQKPAEYKEKDPLKYTEESDGLLVKGKRYMAESLQYVSDTIPQMADRLMGLGNATGSALLALRADLSATAVAGKQISQTMDAMAAFLQLYTRIKGSVNPGGRYIQHDGLRTVKYRNRAGRLETVTINETLDTNALDSEGATLLIHLIAQHGYHWGVDLQSVATDLFQGDNLEFTFTPSTAHADASMASVGDSTLPMRFDEYPLVINSLGEKVSVKSPLNYDSTGKADYHLKPLDYAETTHSWGNLGYQRYRGTLCGTPSLPDANGKVANSYNIQLSDGPLSGSIISIYSFTGPNFVHRDPLDVPRDDSIPMIDWKKGLYADGGDQVTLGASWPGTSYRQSNTADGILSFAPYTETHITIQAQAHDDTGNPQGAPLSAVVKVPIVNEMQDLFIESESIRLASLQSSRLGDYVTNTTVGAASRPVTAVIPHLYTHSIVAGAPPEVQTSYEDPKTAFTSRANKDVGPSNRYEQICTEIMNRTISSLAAQLTKASQPQVV